ncbi:MAG: RsmE family RNA methyltransferase, partial [Nitrospirales bacterium]
MPVFFIEADHIRQGVVTIRGSLFTHLKGSLRVQVGEQIRFTDDRRRRYLVEITEMTRSELHGRVLEEHSAPVRSFPSITLLQAVLKGERMDWVIQKATELGADQIIPVVTRRTIVRPRPG